MAHELLPDPVLLSRPTIRREAVSTSALEGTYAPAAEVLSSEMDAERPRSLAIVEVLNFVDTTEKALTMLNDLPICIRMACELQGILVAGTPSEDWQAGKVRATQVIIGPYKGCSVKEAHFIPPPAGRHAHVRPRRLGKMDPRRSAVGAQPRSRRSRSLPVRGAPPVHRRQRSDRSLAGHPPAHRVRPAQRASDQPLPYFEANADQYRHLLRHVSATGEYDEWVTFFCRGLSAQAQDAEQRIRDLLAWRDATIAMLKGKRVKGVALDVVASMIEYPTINVQSVARRHSVSVQAANSAVGRLCEFGVLREVTGRSYNRAFQARDVLDIFFRPT